jgi:hypothetical protein
MRRLVPMMEGDKNKEVLTITAEIPQLVQLQQVPLAPRRTVNYERRSHQQMQSQYQL